MMDRKEIRRSCVNLTVLYPADWSEIRVGEHIGMGTTHYGGGLLWVDSPF